ncbi:Xaa-Pro aminopeptidase [Pseudoalteromonas luteoviolacea]|uniref:Xaa-Pro aminopeptidase n=1 Tax=Pseudoalteromonas luteoviolacea NCIMB 1942 TaxID=1365253 RepID=A0A167BCI5_9GAMM|nr:Xaa-Pro aminopeptidase [Pseudoalteromonas luteoviolacea]KZN46377.1 proline aminopeptidase P II [Pseudoalteromonas luteoviolacea NCIMB 1942]KZX01464.1 proline aminopeptidase P II [Pseudoalteromonas luteoviolacea]
MIKNEEFVARRQRLLQSLKNNSVAVIPAASEITRSRDTEFPFRQDSDFFYLTGFKEPDAVLILSKGKEGVASSILFCRNKDKLAEIWHGRRIGFEKAKSQLSMDETYALSELDNELLTFINGRQTLYFAQGNYGAFDDKIWTALSTLRGAPKKGYRAPEVIQDIRPLIHEMRLFKSDAEIEVMRKAAKISAEAHVRAMQFAKVGATEYQLEAEIHHHYAMNGARYPAYGTIVGSGNNANILHYTENSDELTQGDLILIDSGCELEGYAADITRTFPVSGKYSDAQKNIYNLVLKAQLAAFAEVKPGGTLVQANNVVMRILTAGLVELGILAGTVDELVEAQACKAFYMHGLGHWLGLDVHDVGEYKLDEADRPFEAGMVLTIEPGLYFDEDAEVPAQYKGIGVRIEDDLLVTQAGYENLTVDVPKSIEQIEALMQKA